MRANPVRENQNDKRTEFWLTTGIKDFEAKKEGEGQKKKKNFMASWSSGNAFVSGAGGLRFKSRAGQIERSVTNGSLRHNDIYTVATLRHFFERSYVARAQ